MIYTESQHSSSNMLSNNTSHPSSVMRMARYEQCKITKKYTRWVQGVKEIWKDKKIRQIKNKQQNRVCSTQL